MQNLKELVRFVLHLAAGFVAAKNNDGKIGFSDLPLFLPLIGEAGPAFDGVEDIAIEWESASPDDRKKVLDELAAEFDLPDDVLERRIEHALKIGADLYALFTDDDADFSTPNLPAQV